MRNLSVALGNSFPPDSELILSKLDHEANLAGWVQLAKWKGLTVKWWAPASPTTNPQLELSDLKPLLSPKTKIVACTHTSNILGTINDIPAIAKLVHTVPGAMLAVDAVAYAPHRPIDVQALGVDFYALSWYKVYGPHVSMLYAAPHTHSEIQSLGHYFKPNVGMGNKLGLGGATYELVQSIPKIIEYVESVTWPAIIAHEDKLQSILLEYLNSRSDTTVYGETSPDGNKRVPVISFGVKGRSSREIVEAIEGKSNFGCRWGDFYSKRLVDEVLCPPKEMEGPVRVSLVHYNTEQEVKNFVKVLDEVLG
jgi:selenocysteine lyase/cysteine desulfurase